MHVHVAKIRAQVMARAWLAFTIMMCCSVKLAMPGRFRLRQRTSYNSLGIEQYPGELIPNVAADGKKSLTPFGDRKVACCAAPADQVQVPALPANSEEDTDPRVFAVVAAIEEADPEGLKIALKAVEGAPDEVKADLKAALDAMNDAQTSSSPSPSSSPPSVTSLAPNPSPSSSLAPSQTRSPNTLKKTSNVRTISEATATAPAP